MEKLVTIVPLFLWPLALYPRTWGTLPFPVCPISQEKNNKVGNFGQKMVFSRLVMLLWLCICYGVCWLCGAASSSPPLCHCPSPQSKPPFLTTLLSQCHLSSCHPNSPLEVIFTPFFFILFPSSLFLLVLFLFLLFLLCLPYPWPFTLFLNNYYYLFVCLLMVDFQFFFLLFSKYCF